MKKQENDLMIGSVKLVNGGMKGLSMKYLETSVRNGMTFLDEVTRQKKVPIHGELMNLFENLGSYLLDICGYTTNELERRILLQNLEITGVDAGTDRFIIKGKLKILNGGKVISLVTPLIKEADEFDGFDSVMELVTEIYSETKSYIGGKMMSNEQLVMTFYKDKEGFNEKEFAKLPEEERKRIALEVMDELGCIVIDDKEVQEVIDSSPGLPEGNASVVESIAEAVVEESATEMNFEFNEEEEG
jgi:hypothetical protein